MDSLQSLFTHIIHLYYGKAFRKLKELEVHPKQVPMLFLLGRKEGLSQREICEEMKIKASTVAVSIKRMEKSGLLVRREDEKDQRIWRIYLTERGKRIGCSLKEIVEESELFDNIGDCVISLHEFINNNSDKYGFCYNGSDRIEINMKDCVIC